MSLRYGTSLQSGAYTYGVGGLGIAAELVPAAGLNGPAYFFDAISLPADNGIEITARVTRWPVLGTLTLLDDTGRYTYTGASDYLLYELRVWDVVVPTDIGYGVGIGRVDFLVGAESTLAGNVTLDEAVAAGTLGSAGGPSGTLSGDAALGPALPGGTLVGDTTGIIDPMGAGMRTIKAGRLVPRTLAPLDVAEVDNLTADMTPVLGADDPIVDVLITCEDRVGTDPAPAPLLYADWQVQGPLVRQRIKGSLGVVGVTYLIRVQATANSGKVAVATGFVKVVRLA